MNVEHINKTTYTRHHFIVKHENKRYEVAVYIDKKGKFIDDNIKVNSNFLEYSTEECQIRNDILTYIDENWDEYWD